MVVHVDQVFENTEVVFAVAQPVVDHDDALGVMGDRGLFHHAHAAEQLDRFLGDLAAGFADLGLGGGDALFAQLRLHVEAAGGEHGDGTYFFQLHAHFHHAVLQGLELTDRHAELLAFLDVVQGLVAGHFHGAGGFRAQGDQRQVQSRFQSVEGLAFVAEQRVGADFHVLEGDVGGVQAVDGRVAAAADAVGAGVDDEGAEAVFVVAAAAGAGDHHQLVGAVTVQDHGFLAVDHVAVAVFLGAGFHETVVVATLGFVVGQGEAGFTADDSRQVLLFLGVVAELVDQHAGQHHGGQVGFHHQAAAEAFGHHHQFRAAAVEAAGLFGERHAQQAQFGELGPGVGAEAVL